MANAVSIRVLNADVIQAKLRAVPIRFQNAATKQLGSIGLEGGNILRGLLSAPQRRDPFWGATGANSPVGLGIRTGKTRQQVVATGRVYNDGSGNLWSFIGHPSQHLKVLEDGGTVEGKPWLRIPTAAAQKPSGADKWPGMKAPNSFVYPTRRMVNFKAGRPKNLWVVRSAGKGRGLEKLYLLKPSVTLKPHHTFRTLDAALQPKMCCAPVFQLVTFPARSSSTTARSGTLSAARRNGSTLPAHGWNSRTRARR